MDRTINQLIEKRLVLIDNEKKKKSLQPWQNVLSKPTFQAEIVKYVWYVGAWVVKFSCQRLQLTTKEQPYHTLFELPDLFVAFL